METTIRKIRRIINECDLNSEVYLAFEVLLISLEEDLAITKEAKVNRRNPTGAPVPVPDF